MRRIQEKDGKHYVQERFLFFWRTLFEWDSHVLDWMDTYDWSKAQTTGIVVKITKEARSTSPQD